MADVQVGAEQPARLESRHVGKIAFEDDDIRP